MALIPKAPFTRHKKSKFQSLFTEFIPEFIPEFVPEFDLNTDFYPGPNSGMNFFMSSKLRLNAGQLCYLVIPLFFCRGLGLSFWEA